MLLTPARTNERQGYAPASSNAQRTQDGSLRAIAEVRLPSLRMKVNTAEARSQTIR